MQGSARCIIYVPLRSRECKMARITDQRHLLFCFEDRVFQASQLERILPKSQMKLLIHACGKVLDTQGQAYNLIGEMLWKLLLLPAGYALGFMCDASKFMASMQCVQRWVGKQFAHSSQII
jgi:hypothetical protein